MDKTNAQITASLASLHRLGDKMADAVDEGPPRRLTLTDFLLARIAEDKAGAVGMTGDLDDLELQSPPSAVVVHPNRWLAECEAKRRIVRLASECERHGYDNAAAYMNDALLALALPYADHPDYREEWKP